MARVNDVLALLEMFTRDSNRIEGTTSNAGDGEQEKNMDIEVYLLSTKKLLRKASTSRCKPPL